MRAPGVDVDEFTRCWHDNAGRVGAYARRHVDDQGALDVVAETFAVAWRRWSEVPRPPLPWLLATARRVIANERRSARRRAALLGRLEGLAAVAAPTAADAGHLALEREHALRALAGLGDDLREALLLVSWDGLTNQEAAFVLGVSDEALRARVHRARSALRRIELPVEADQVVVREPTNVTKRGTR